MSLEYRIPAEAETRDAMIAADAASGGEMHEEDFERELRTVPRDRFLAAYDEGRPVGLTGSYPFDLTVPGGTVSAAGVTWVGVLPSHRRRGILRELMRRQLEDVRARGEPVAILWASEAAIYGRFGYGIAAPNASLAAQRPAFALRDAPAPTASVRLISQDEAREAFPPLYERIRLARPGMLSRSEQWWREHRLADPEHWRRGAGPKFYAVLEVDRRAEGFAMYRVAPRWDNGTPQGELRVIEAQATSPEATRELWRFLFGIDLVATVRTSIFDPNSPLFLMVVDPRSLHITLSDGLWLRLLDVEQSLRARSYSSGDSVVIEVLDELCEWNVGRYRVGENGGRTPDGADLRLHVADLASLYLGGFDVHRLAAAGRIEELSPGALDRAGRIFRTHETPFCPEVF